jgi:hypothetical protein
MEENNTTAETVLGGIKKLKKDGLVNKRIDFDQRTIKKLNIMLPLYKDEIGEGAKESELYSYVISKGIESLFDGEFKKRIEEL